MRNNVLLHNVSISKKQMMDLIINQKDINITSKEGEKITISKPISFTYKIDPKTKNSSYVVSSKITLETGTYIGTVTLKSEGNKTYTGTLTFKE